MERNRSSAVARLWPRVCVALAVVLLSAGLVVWRWSAPGPLVTADTWWYARGALMYSGATQIDAERWASLLICVQRHSPAAADDPACANYRAVTNPRYARIFTTRPLYPLLAAPLVRPLGGVTAALKAVTLAFCIAAGAFMYGGVRRSGGGRLAGFSAIAALFVLPSGFWMTRLNAEAPMMAGVLAVIWGLLAWRDGRASGMAWAVAGLAWIFADKPANAVAVAVALLAGAGLAAAFDARDARGRNRAVFALGALAVLGWVVVSTVLRLPSYNDTLQDLATRHFVSPDVPDPWRYLLHNNLGLVKSQTWSVLKLVWPWLVIPAGVGAIIVQLRWRAMPWLAVAASGVLAVMAHPLRSEYPRLLIPLWLAVAAGIGLLADRGFRRLVFAGRVPSIAARPASGLAPE